MIRDEIWFDNGNLPPGFEERHQESKKPPSPEPPEENEYTKSLKKLTLNERPKQSRDSGKR